MAKILIIVGGIVLILGAVVEVMDIQGLSRIAGDIRIVGGLTGAVIGIVAGAMALAGSKQVTNLAWSVILVILGLFVGTLGGTLVFVGALIGLVLNFVKT